MRSYWTGQDVIAINKIGTWPYTPATNLLMGLKEAVTMSRKRASKTSSRATAPQRGDARGDQGVGPGRTSAWIQMRIRRP